MIPFASCEYVSILQVLIIDTDDVHVYICSNRECSLQLNSSKSCFVVVLTFRTVLAILMRILMLVVEALLIFLEL